MRTCAKEVSGVMVFSFLVMSSVNALCQKVMTEKQISLELANEAAMAGMRQCRQDGFRVSVVVFDRGGHTKVVIRDDGAGMHTLDSARRKAYTALTFRVPSAEFAKRVATTPALAELEGVIALAGGLPIKSGDEVIGSIAVAGAPSGGQDEACAQAGINSLKDRL